MNPILLTINPLLMECCLKRRVNPWQAAMHIQSSYDFQAARIFFHFHQTRTFAENQRRPQESWMACDGLDGRDKRSDGWENTGLVPGHAYAVLGVMQSGDVVEHVVYSKPIWFRDRRETRWV